MNLDKLKNNWEGLGDKDPFWAVLTNPLKKGNKWHQDDFFKKGRRRIQTLFKKLNLEHQLKYNKALDFGCGPGRLSQALCPKFERVVGVDISSSMIRKAKALNKFPDKRDYLVNNTNDLSQLPSNEFDLTISLITLQHMEPIFALNYIKEFKRVTANNGYIIFNIPSKPPPLLKFLMHIVGLKGVNFIRKIYYRRKYIMEMHWIEEQELRTFLSSIELDVIQTVSDKSVGSKWKSNLYLIKKIVS